jgi:hypothetical protein
MLRGYFRPVTPMPDIGDKKSVKKKRRTPYLRPSSDIPILTECYLSAKALIVLFCRCKLRSFAF